MRAIAHHIRLDTSTNPEPSRWIISCVPYVRHVVQRWSQVFCNRQPQTTSVRERKCMLNQALPVRLGTNCGYCSTIVVKGRCKYFGCGRSSFVDEKNDRLLCRKLLRMDSVLVPYQTLTRDLCASFGLLLVEARIAAGRGPTAAFDKVGRLLQYLLEGNQFGLS